MTNAEKKQVEALRREGFAYSAIAREMRLSVNTVKAHCQRNGVEPEQNFTRAENKLLTLCPFCGARIESNNRKKRFCSTRCRVAYFRQNHPDDNRGEVVVIIDKNGKTCYNELVISNRKIS